MVAENTILHNSITNGNIQRFIYLFIIIFFFFFFSEQKIENFHCIKFDIFDRFAQNIDCGFTLEPPRPGGSNVYPQSMFWINNKKNRYTPANPSFSI